MISSLFEILIVIAVLSFIVLLSLSFVSFSDNLFARIELEKLYAFMSFVQQSAKVDNKTKYIIFDTQNNCYKFQNYKYRLNKNLKFGIINSNNNSNNNIKGPPSNPHNLIKDPITFKNGKVIFYPDGTISSGVIYLTNKNSTQLYALSSAVSQISYLRRYKYNSNWCLIN